MYTEIKARRLRSSGTSSGAYSGYQSTVRNAKKTPAKIKRHRRQQYESCDGSNQFTHFRVYTFFINMTFCVDSNSKSESESVSEDELVEVSSKGKRREEMSDHSRDPDDEEEAQLPGPAVDGERIKGKYTLRKIQPVERYCPIGTILTFFHSASA